MTVGIFVKKCSRGNQDFLVKMGGSPYSHIGVGWGRGAGVACRKGGKHWFSLVMYGFCSSNALYSASLSFRMFIINLD